jgi:hypothetical protein
MNFLTLIIEAISQNQSDEEIQKLSHGHESAIRSEIDALLNADFEKLLRILFPGGVPWRATALTILYGTCPVI